MNQAKLIYGVGSQDHGHLCQEVSDGKETRGDFRNSADVLLLVLINWCWLHGCAFFVRIHPFIYLCFMYLSVCMLYTSIKSLPNNPHPCYKRSNI